MRKFSIFSFLIWLDVDYHLQATPWRLVVILRALEATQSCVDVELEEINLIVLFITW